MENFILQYDNDPSKFLDPKSAFCMGQHSKDLIRRKFQDLVLLPNIIGDKEYLARKKTFDIFLKKTDSQFFNMFLKHEKGIISKGKSNHDGINNDKNLVKKSEGKMLSNELWSETYYRTIMNSSYIGEKFEKIVNEVKLRNYETKIKITDDYYKKTHQSFFRRQTILSELYKNFDNPTMLRPITEKHQFIRKHASSSLSEWVPKEKKCAFEDLEIMRGNVYGLIKNCNTASSKNQTLKKLI